MLSGAARSLFCVKLVPLRHYKFLPGRYIRQLLPHPRSSPPSYRRYTMASNEASSMESQLAPLRKNVQEQGEIVRRLKEEGRPKLEIQAAVAELKVRKKALEQREAQLAPKEAKFDRSGLEDLLKRRFFYAQSFEIYGGVAGLYDFGPIGCVMKSNLISQWRSHFLLEDGILEIDCSIMTPEDPLKASGHVDRFSDFMVKDVVTGEYFRADHLLQDHLEQLASDPKCPPEKAKEYAEVVAMVDNYSQSELEQLFQKYSVVAPLTKNSLSPPMEFNLMFSTTIGPGSALRGFLRPETAQGIFVNFKRLLEFNNGKLPFGGAQIGRAFRNEISPRSGLLRVREFEMAEIEYFVNPMKKATFPKFPSVSDLQITIYSACDQMDGKSPRQINLGEAVQGGIIANQTLGYFIGRIHQFLLKVGVAPDKLRFRQHLSNEMAHYATDCWDAECKTLYGWVECVGCADRACYDLTQHAIATKVDMSAKIDLAEPRTEEVIKVIPDKGIIGKQFRKDAKALMDWLNQLDRVGVEDLESRMKGKGVAEVEVGGKTFELQEAMIKIKRDVETVYKEDVVPSVVEPSFGLGRILYAVLEHSFSVREGDEQRVWLSLPPVMAPIACSVLPLSASKDFHPFVAKIAQELKRRNVAHRVDDSNASIGRRYARTDEIGIPFGVTVDFDTVKTSTVTLRERNSTRQVRISVDEVALTVSDLVAGHMMWDQVQQKYPLFKGQESTQ